MIVRRKKNAGAAILIVVALMAVLLAIGLSFFYVTRNNVIMSKNITNTVRADHLLDGAFAIAMSHLNRDLIQHPDITSTDHPWSTLFNGSWCVGKKWTFGAGVSPVYGGVPEVDLNKPAFGDAFYGEGGSPGPRIYPPLQVCWCVQEDPDPNVPPNVEYYEQLFQGPRTREWLYYPRVEPAWDPTKAAGGPTVYQKKDEMVRLAYTDPVTGYFPTFVPEDRYFVYDQENVNTHAAVPFILPTFYGPYPAMVPVPPDDQGGNGGDDMGYPSEIVNRWADVDNDNDNFKDSVWFPIPIDEYFDADGVDNNLNGMVDETPDNKINDDQPGEGNDLMFQTYPWLLNEAIDPLSAGPSPKLDPIYYYDSWHWTYTGAVDPDEALEPGAFVYYGGDDGLDNDGDGFVDDLDSEANGASAPWEVTDQPPYGYFLTVPLPGLSLPVDLNADGVPGDPVPISNDGGASIEETAMSLHVVLPNRIRVIVNRIPGVASLEAIFLGPEHVDVLDNDYDQFVNNYYTYCYMGPNTLNGPPFVMKGFDPDIKTILFKDDAFNSYLSDTNAVQPIQYRGSLNGPPTTLTVDPFNPLPYYADIWRMPGNWFEGFLPVTNYDDHGNPVTTTNDVSDATLFANARAAAYVDINTEACFDFDNSRSYDPSEMQFLPSTAYYYDATGAVQSYDLNQFLPYLRVTLSGEPVCSIAGRAAVLIKDEATKVNFNIAGGHSLEDLVKDDSPSSTEPLDNLKPAGGDASSPFEYLTKSLPGGLGGKRAKYLWTWLTGVPNVGIEDVDANNLNQQEMFKLDVTLPGYGRTDDNGDFFLRSMNGIDDDGDDFIDEGLRWGVSVDGANDSRGLLGMFEGIDEPGELQQYTPLRDRIAESDRLDNDGDNIVDEIGELGDRQFQHLDQVIQDVAGIGDTNEDRFRLHTTLYSTDRSVAFVETSDGGVRAFNNLDFNRASAAMMARQLLICADIQPVTSMRKDAEYYAKFPNDFNWEDGGLLPTYANGAERKGLIVGAYPPPPDEGLRNYKNDVNCFALGLRSADLNTIAPNMGADLYGGILHHIYDYPEGSGILHRAYTREFPADPQLQMFQIAADAVDFRDYGHARTCLVTERIHLADASNKLDSTTIYWPPAPVSDDPDLYENMRDRISGELVPMQKIQADMEETYGIVKDIQYFDDWWGRLVSGNGEDNNASLDYKQQGKFISYAVSGNDSIRITELEIRPTRRLEAEATPSRFLAFTDSDSDGVDDNGDSTAPTSFDKDTGSYLNMNTPNLFPTPVTDANPISPLDPNPDFGMPRFVFGRDCLASTLLSGGMGWGVSGNNQLGDQCCWKTNPGLYNPDAGLTPAYIDQTSSGTPIPNIIQFIITATDGDFFYDEVQNGTPGDNAAKSILMGVPPGRYYLTVNTNDETGLPTVDGPNQLLYSIKYFDKEVSGDTIIDDLNSVVGAETDHTGALTLYKNAFFEKVGGDIDDDKRYFIGYDAKGNNTGMVFIPGQRVSNKAKEIQAFRNFCYSNHLWATPKLFESDPSTPQNPWSGAVDVVFEYDPDAYKDNPDGFLQKYPDEMQEYYFLDGNGRPNDDSRRPYCTKRNEDINGDGIVAVDEYRFYYYWPGLDADGDGIVVDDPDPIGNVDSPPDPLHGFALPDTINGDSNYHPTRTFTIDVPAHDGDADRSTPDAICVAFAMDPASTKESLAINYLELSQEPDHEYVELTNTSNDEVYVGGWQLEVGIPHATGAPDDPYTTVWRIPGGTSVEPLGKLLLTFQSEENDLYSKFDKFKSDPSLYSRNLLNSNGIGMAAGDYPYNDPASPLIVDISTVTVPPISDMSPLVETFGLVNPYRYFDSTGSVFLRYQYVDPMVPSLYNFTDYLDTDGDGFSSILEPLASSRTSTSPIVSLGDRWTLFEIDTTDVDDPANEIDQISVLNHNYWSRDNEDTASFFDGNKWDTDRSLLAMRHQSTPGPVENEYIKNELVNSYGADLTTHNGELMRAAWMANRPWDRIVPLENVTRGKGDLVNAINIYRNEQALLNDGDPLNDPVNPHLTPAQFPRQDDSDFNGFPYNPNTKNSDDDETFYNLLNAGTTASDENYALRNLAQLVLGGGALPNYPEHDGRDNDGDGGYLQADGIYVPGALDMDLVDNDLDNIIDERPVVNELAGLYGLFPNPLMSEGVDEGRGTGYGEYHANTIPIQFFNNRDPGGSAPYPSCGEYLAAMDSAGGLVDPDYISGVHFFMAAFNGDDPFLIESANYNGGIVYANAVGINAMTAVNATLIARLGDPYWHSDPANEPDYRDLAWMPGIASGVPQDQAYMGNIFPSLSATMTISSAKYLGSKDDPPDWKAFTERRWNPGDNVIVTLYAGDYTSGKVADRVTYTEWDVVNRTVDDVITVDYNGDGYIDPLAETFNSLQDRYPSMLLPNQMGLDFYRSLERKHPLYAGDRHGTQNRWEATDGNYDDWADSLSPFERLLTLDPKDGTEIPKPDFIEPVSGDTYGTYFGRRFVGATGNEGPGAPDPGNNPTPSRDILERWQMLHAFYGSPLRKNAAERVLENPFNYVFVTGGADSTAMDNRPNNWAMARQFDSAPMLEVPSAFNYKSFHRIETFNDSTYNLPGIKVRDRFLASVADILQMPHLEFTNNTFNTAKYFDYSSGLNRYAYPTDVTELNTQYKWIDDNRTLRQNRSLQGVYFGQDVAPESPTATLTENVISGLSNQSIMLTAAQADVLQIRPNVNETQILDTSVVDMNRIVGWSHDTDAGYYLRAPAMWMPFYGFISDTEIDDIGQIMCNYADSSQNPYPVQLRRPTLVGTDYVFGTAPSMFDADIFVQKLFHNTYFNSPSATADTLMPLIDDTSQLGEKQRWPIEKRPIFYWSQAAEGLIPGEVVDYSGVTKQAWMANRPEAVFIWDAEDGLENGEYTVYVGMMPPEWRDRVIGADEAYRNYLMDKEGVTATQAFDENLVSDFLDSRGVKTSPTDDVLENQEFLASYDPDTLEKTYSPHHLEGTMEQDVQLGIEVYTNRTAVRGIAPAGTNGVGSPLMAHPDDWLSSHGDIAQAGQFTVNEDGYVVYADADRNPVTVYVNDNFLALRLRNLSNASKVAMFSHVLLAPRKRQPGRFNLNTVTTELDRNPKSPEQQLYSPLMGIPGIAKAGDGTAPDNFEATNIWNSGADNALYQPWPSPTNFATDAMQGSAGTVLVPPKSDKDDLLKDPSNDGRAVAAFQLSAMLMAGRREYADGRYYKSLADLLNTNNFFEYAYTADPNGPKTGAILPLSAKNEQEGKYADMLRRFKGSANLLTLRSDVFEIIVTVQAGYGRDANSDGKINYRGQDEFSVTAESKGRAVYERRAPSDASREKVSKQSAQ